MRKREAATHPNDGQLQCYADGELDPDSRDRMRLHLQRCTACQGRLATWQQLSQAVQATRPALEGISSEGAFWLRLAGRLQAAQPERWPWVPYLPPFVLSAFGILVNALISVVLVLSLLAQMGILRPLGSLVGEGLEALLSHSLLDTTLYAWFGWSAEAVTLNTMRAWSGVARNLQEAIVLVAVLQILGGFLWIIVALYVSWALCWTRPASIRRKE